MEVRGSGGDSGFVFGAIGGFWRPGSADNAGPHRSVAPNADARSGDKQKDWRPVPVYHRRQGCSVARYLRKFSHVNYDGSFVAESSVLSHK